MAAGRSEFQRRLDGLLRGLFFEENGRPRSASLLYSFLFSFLFLAVYAAARAGEEKQKQIAAVRSFDGPGFLEDTVSGEAFAGILPRTG